MHKSIQLFILMVLVGLAGWAMPQDPRSDSPTNKQQQRPSSQYATPNITQPSAIQPNAQNTQASPNQNQQLSDKVDSPHSQQKTSTDWYTFWKWGTVTYFSLLLSADNRGQSPINE